MSQIHVFLHFFIPDEEKYILGQLRKCHEAVGLIYEMEKRLYDDGIIDLGEEPHQTNNKEVKTFSNKSLIQLEATLLDIASTPELCQGASNMFPVKVGDKFIIR